MTGCKIIEDALWLADQIENQLILTGALEEGIKLAERPATDEEMETLYAAIKQIENMNNALSWDNEIDHLKAWGFIELHDHEQRSFLRYVDQGSVYQDWRIFQHEKTSRNVISIALRPLEDEDQKYHEVFVQEDAGCDHLVMPFRWSNLDYKWLNALKMSFDGEGLKGERLYE